MVVTSWDDGHPLDRRVAGLLERYGVAGTFFIPSANREGRPVLPHGDIRALNSRFEVGSHTETHAYLGDLSPEEAQQEIALGKTHLEEIVGHTVEGFCFPGGQMTSSLKKLVRTMGFSYARSTENLRLGPWNDRWAIPTTLQLFPHSGWVLARNALKHPSAGKFALVSSKFTRPTYLSYVSFLIDKCESEGGVFHLWGHSWEIEQHGLWDVLEATLRLCSKASMKSMTVGQAVKQVSEA